MLFGMLFKPAFSNGFILRIFKEDKTNSKTYAFRTFLYKNKPSVTQVLLPLLLKRFDLAGKPATKKPVKQRVAQYLIKDRSKKLAFFVNEISFSRGVKQSFVWQLYNWFPQKIHHFLSSSVFAYYFSFGFCFFFENYLPLTKPLLKNVVKLPYRPKFVLWVWR